MTEQDRNAFASTVFQRLVDIVYILSNVDFQLAVWVFDSHLERYVGDYDETVEMFQENLEWLLNDDLWRIVPLQLGQVNALRQLYSSVESFDHGKRGLHAKVIMSDPAWAAITSLAGETLAELAINPLGVRPSIA